MNDLKQLLERKDIKIEIVEETLNYTICVAHEIGMWNCNIDDYDIALHYIVFDGRGSYYYDSYELECIEDVKKELV